MIVQDHISLIAHSSPLDSGHLGPQIHQIIIKTKSTYRCCVDGLYPYSVTCSKIIPYRDFMSRTVKKLKLTILIMATQCMTFCFLVNFAGSYYKTIRIYKIICSRIGTIMQSQRYTASNDKLKQETFLCMDKGSLHGSDILTGFISCVE